MGGQFLAQGGADTNVSITGGVGAFLAMFLLALAVWALGWSMTRHLRRVSYAEKQQAAEEREHEAAEARRREAGPTDRTTEPDADVRRTPPGGEDA
ncbi:hypothetical protein [Kytococcus sp. Marseille-QA3725]